MVLFSWWVFGLLFSIFDVWRVVNWIPRGAMEQKAKWVMSCEGWSIGIFHVEIKQNGL